jgi:tetratricopeptide (TPR) repeat protein
MRFFLTIFLFSGSCVSALACLWDRDTLAMERQRFPTALELITGKFLRHSNDFYQWRVEDTKARIELSPTAELYDDLAVAYEKLGNTNEAIRVIEKKASLYPGLYSTHANLGTFFFHSGKYGPGLQEIDKALVINPEAHFGREVYQKLLVEYLLSKRADGESVLPLSNDRPSQFSPTGFGVFVIEQNLAKRTEQSTKQVVDEAVQGVLGMMKFGHYDSPVLLEVLADLLMSREPTSDAKLLAARAYLKASYEATDPNAKAAYRKKADDSLKYQTRTNGSNDEIPLTELEQQFKKELNDAQSWYETLAQDEKSWIDTGVNVEAAFDQKYYATPVVRSAVGSGPFSAMGALSSMAIVASLIAVLLITLVCTTIFLSKRKRRQKENDNSSVV